MNKLEERAKQLQQAGECGLMTHVVVGYPSLERTERIVEVMEECGADFVELQIPFSDPLADGPTIQRACEVSLEQGTKVKDAFVLAKKLSKKVEIPLLFMGYFNTVFAYGTEKFCRDAQKAGISGLIIPDVPLEAAEHEKFLQYCERYNLCNIVTISPASTNERLEKNAKIAKGFVYCMARQGITGATKGLDPEVEKYLENVRKYIKLPLAVGFGISNSERLGLIRPHCEIAVVGSAAIEVVQNDKSKDETALRKFLKDLLE